MRPYQLFQRLGGGTGGGGGGGGSGTALDALIMALSPFAYYKLDETTGTTLADSSGNGRDITASGTVTVGQPPLLAPGYSALFGGGRGLSTAFIAALTSAFNGDKPFTMEALIKPASLSANHVLMHAGEVSTGGTQGFFMFVNASGQLWLQAFVGSWAYFGGGSGIAVGTMSHVAVKREVGGASKCLINGVVVATGSIAGSIALAGGGGAGLGVCDLSIGGNPFSGNMDYVALYTTALSDAQLLLHAQAAGVA